jgi:NAD(P)H-hydrate epimerase
MGMEKIQLPLIPPRKHDAHKGDFGRVLIVGGSEWMIGAPALAANAAMRSGAGLCRVAAPKDTLLTVLALCPTATGFPLPARDTKPFLEFADSHDALVVGPGLGASASARRLVIDLIERHHGPMVLDADALNILSSLESSEWPQRRDWSNIILTPHMGEFMRLMAAVTKRGASLTSEMSTRGTDSAPTVRSLVDDEPSTADGVPLEVEPAATAVAPTPAAESVGTDRSALAELLSRATGCVVVLKGANTVVALGARFALNRTGNPAMATGGSGDVLAGVIGTFLAQGYAPDEAALLGVHIHGLAGDIAAREIGAIGLVATDLINYLPAAIKQHMKI